MMETTPTIRGPRIGTLPANLAIFGPTVFITGPRVFAAGPKNLEASPPTLPTAPPPTLLKRPLPAPKILPPTFLAIFPAPFNTFFPI